MGAGANEADMIAVMAALEETLHALGWKTKAGLVERFLRYLYEEK